MSWFGSNKSSSNSHAGATNFWPATSYNTGFGELTESDTAWLNASNQGFQTETNVWYSVLEDGSLLMVQIIWSYLGIFLIPATTQMTFKHYNPTTKKAVWKSVHASNAKFDKQSCKSDLFEIRHSGSPAEGETYNITASLEKDVQITVEYTKPADAPGFKLGSGPDGGISTFGKDKAKREGYVVHRFHPFIHSSGTVIINGQAVDAKGEGIFIHAIQGMRPNLIASRWNFCFFSTAPGQDEEKLGSVRAFQMEFETTDDFGPKGAKSGRTKVNIGGIYCSKTAPVPFLITGQTHAPSSDSTYPVPSQDISSATHLNPVHDSETGYSVPSGIEFKWQGDRRDGQGKAGATLVIEKAGKVPGEGGLIEKVDVLAEIPYVIKKGLTAMTGTNAYIYQYHNPATLEIKLDENVIPVKGFVFNEASFISP
ncbi:survival factor 1 [Cryptococcus neoformans]|nr:survival factor 1 [Cryptococcus neoformans var. grubii]